jgi:hypothetical protein
VTAAIRSLRPQASTAIGEGIYTSLAALAQVPPDPDNPKAVPPARIVLLSDGKTQVGRPSDQAAMAARAQGVPIYTIAYGTPDGYIDIGGRREPVPVDRAELARVSKISGGEAYTAESAGGAQTGLQGHRKFGRQGEGGPGGHLPLRRFRVGLRDPCCAGDDLARRPLAITALTRAGALRWCLVGPQEFDSVAVDFALTNVVLHRSRETSALIMASAAEHLSRWRHGSRRHALVSGAIRAKPVATACDSRVSNSYSSS